MAIAYGLTKSNTIHELKIDPAPFDAVIRGWKFFEVRKNDRGFKNGDRLLLKEYNPASKKYTGNEYTTPPICCIVMDYGLKEGFVALGWLPIDN